MKVYKEELEIFNSIKKSDYPRLDTAQLSKIKDIIKSIREESSKYKHMLLQATPFIVYFILLILVLTMVNNIIILSLLHGALGYFFVVYALHEGAGHGLFKRNNLLNNLAFNSSRLFFADPNYYKKIHTKHHRYLGSEQDLAFTHFILLRRFLKSITPGAGVLFKNDFCVHTDSKLSLSLIKSILIGSCFFGLEFYILKDKMSSLSICISLLLISPWIGMTLDRLREIAEHHNMAEDRVHGSRELGLRGMMFFIVGGPAGQPFHFSHHLAPDLNWYQQIKLHNKLKTILTEDQKYTYGFKKKQTFNFYKKIILSLRDRRQYV